MDRISFLFIMALALTACAHDNYTAIPNGPGSQDRLAADLRACKHMAEVEYAQQGADPNALVGSAFGSANRTDITGAQRNANGGSKPADVAQATQVCMKEKGYQGASE